MKSGDDSRKNVSTDIGAGRSLAGGAYGLSRIREQSFDPSGRTARVVGAGKLSALPEQEGAWLRSCAGTAVAASQRVPVAVGDGVCVAPWRVSKLPEDLHGASTVGRTEPGVDAGV